MPDLRQQKGILVALILVIFALCFCAVRTVEQPQSPGYDQHEYKNAQSGQESEPGETTWKWLTKDAASFFTFILALLTAVLAGVSVIQIFYLRRSDETSRRSADAALKAADAAYKQAEISERALVAANRPWLTVDAKIAGRAIVSGTDIKFSFRFTVRNIGASPALKVHLAPIVLDRMSCSPQIQEFIHTVFMDGHIIKELTWGRSIAPNGEQIFSYSMGFRPDIFQAAVELNRK